jgi:hypothetical protein
LYFDFPTCYTNLVLLQVHRPLFTGHPSGLGSQGKCQVYQSPFTDPSQKADGKKIIIWFYHIKINF